MTARTSTNPKTGDTEMHLMANWSYRDVLNAYSEGGHMLAVMGDQARVIRIDQPPVRRSIAWGYDPALIVIALEAVGL